MTIVACAICTRSGAIVASRQFLPIARQRIETLLSTFPRLLQAGQQHTYVETNEVRFLYQPLEVHYVVLVTSLGSNILEDMETLRLVVRVIGEYAGGSRTAGEETDALRETGLEIMLALDEIITAGWRESTVGLSQLHTILAMESQEEVVQEIIAKNKMQEAKEAAKRKLKQMEMEKKEAARRASAGGRRSIGGDGYSPVDQRGMMAEAPSFAPPASAQGRSIGSASATSAAAAPTIQMTAKAGQGMKLGKKIHRPIQ